MIRMRDYEEGEEHDYDRNAELEEEELYLNYERDYDDYNEEDEEEEE